MRAIYFGLLVGLLVLPQPSRAQSGAAASPDTTQSAPKKKKGGLFGKVKALTQNKTLQQVAKTAACNMVPGGQLVASALDNASAKNAAKDAAKDAATGAALGAVAGKQSTCGPGMGLMGKVGGSGLAGAVVGAGIPGAGVPGLPTTGLTGAAISAQQMKQMEEQYKKMGMNPAQIQAMQQQMTMASPGEGMSADQMKQLMDQYKKMGMDPAQLQAMQQMMAAASPAAAAGLTGGAPSAAATPSAAAIPAPTLKKEKNRFELRQLPWLPNSESIRPGAEETFTGAIHGLATELQAGTRHYKIEVKVEDQGSKAQNQALAQQRAAVVVSFLVSQGITESRLTIGDGAADKDTRVVVSENKSGK